MPFIITALKQCSAETWRKFHQLYHGDASLIELQEKYGLVGKVDWRTDTNCKAAKRGGIAITFVRILKPDESPEPLPPGFLEEATLRLRALYRKTPFPVSFHVHPTGMTLEEIQAEQKSWNVYCEMAWAASG
ncbi:MAG: hypothetical protein WCV85_01460 [Patescibacteria group bacterium]